MPRAAEQQAACRVASTSCHPPPPWLRAGAVWPSCPALGWTAGVRRLDSLPTGTPLTTPPNGPTIETHGPYQHGSGFPAVNGGSTLQLFDANLPLQLKPTPTGLALPNVFASEVTVCNRRNRRNLL